MKFAKLFSFLVLLTIFFFSCQKEYSLENPVTPPGTWQFNDSSKLYIGLMDSAGITTSGSTKILSLAGKSSDGKETFRLQLFSTDSFPVGTYKASLSQINFEYYNISKTLYAADQFTGEFIVIVTAIGNGQITGTFSGAAKDSANVVKQITNGKFTSKISLSGTGTGGGGTALGTLGSSSGACLPVTPAGVYQQGTALTAANTVTVQVNVSSPGTYSISTNTVNGVSFSKTGTFTAAGAQSVVLSGTGTPVNSGSQTFTVTFGSSTCTFPITFAQGTAPAQDYFPTTTGSFWAYGNKTPADSFKNTVTSGSKTLNTINNQSQVYTVVLSESVPASGSPDSLFFRKTNGLYYEAFDISSTSTPSYFEYKFLDTTVSVGTSWQSQNFTITSQGTSYTIYIKATLFQKATTPTTSGVVTSSDVLKVRYEYFASVPGLPAAIIFIEERWFAKGIGMIYDSFDDRSGSAPDVYNIGRYQVN